MESKYKANSGQNFYPPSKKGLIFPQTPFEFAPHIEDVDPLAFHPKFADTFVQLADVSHKLIGVTPEMLDWFWANMEKGYLLWAPGEHHGFEWDPAPWEVGYEGSCEVIYEFDITQPMRMTRLSMAEYPFTECYDHCWLGRMMVNGVYWYLVHMYQSLPGGTHWRSIPYMKKDEAHLLPADFAKGEPGRADHMEYEAGRLRYFLPQLYALWQGHPDPWQNVRYDLHTRQNADGTWSHICDNRPPHLK